MGSFCLLPSYFCLLKAFISAFDDKDNLLGSFSIPGTSSTVIDNSAVFIGVSNEIANISKLVISSSENNRALGINFLSISRTSIPEPGTILALSLFGIGLLFNKQKFAN
ncbi:PEP-CTERM sorting domain-containing protein [Nostoc sp. FACHB-973]|nr:PEP-CTERM sorting domain-containing protein [Nostoc sp. FACHB-973]